MAVSRRSGRFKIWMLEGFGAATEELVCAAAAPLSETLPDCCPQVGR